MQIAVKWHIEQSCHEGMASKSHQSCAWPASQHLTIWVLADGKEDFYRTTVEGCLFQMLAPLASQQSNQSPLVQHLLSAAAPLPPPKVPDSSRDIPLPSPQTAPVGEPTEKDRVKLQVRGLFPASRSPAIFDTGKSSIWNVLIGDLANRCCKLDHTFLS